MKYYIKDNKTNKIIGEVTAVNYGAARDKLVKHGVEIDTITVIRQDIKRCLFHMGGKKQTWHSKKTIAGVIG